MDGIAEAFFTISVKKKNRDFSAPTRQPAVIPLRGIFKRSYVFCFAGRGKRRNYSQPQDGDSERFHAVHSNID
jgi:hypothetical protein